MDNWSDPEPTLADIQGEFPGWVAWRDTAGLCYARLAGESPDHQAQARGEDPRDLRDSITRWLGLHADEVPEANS